MRMIDTRGRWFELGITSELRTGNLVWVDAVNGDDATALPHREDRPYQTLAAASAAAVSGDTVYVLPGDYSTTTSIAKAGVNWHFIIGTKVSVATTALFNVSAAAEFSVTGDATFLCTSGAVISVAHSSAKVWFRCAMIKASGMSSAVVISAGYVYLDFPYDVIADTGFSGQSLIEVSGGILNATGRTIVNTLTSTPVVLISGTGSFAFRGVRIKGNGHALSITSTGGAVAITAEDVASVSDHAIAATGNPSASPQVVVSLNSVKVSAAAGGKLAISIGSPNYLFLLTRVMLGAPTVPDVSPTICIGATSTTLVGNYSIVYCLNSSQPAGNIAPVGKGFEPLGLPG